MPGFILEIVYPIRMMEISSAIIQIEEIDSNQLEGTFSGSEFVSGDVIDGEGDSGDVREMDVDDTPLHASFEHTNDEEGGILDSGLLLSSTGQRGDMCEGGECSNSDSDELFCTICMQAWTNGGEHCVCCLPCGHLYGMSCIKKWLKQCKSTGGKCPQCNKKCTLKDVRKLYASRIVAVDEESVQNVKMLESKCTSLEEKCSVIEEYCRSLEEKCEFLEEKRSSFDLLASGWAVKECEWRTKENSLQQLVQQLTDRATYLQQLLGDKESRLLGSVDFEDSCWNPSTPGHIPNHNRMKTTCSFRLHEEYELEGARNFDMDPSNTIAIVVGRIPRKGGVHVLSKAHAVSEEVKILHKNTYNMRAMSLVVPRDSDLMHLPSTTKVIKDVRISPNGELALLASLGKKLHILSMGTNNVVQCYDLPAAAWSCTWDMTNSNLLYAGLQNGMLLAFDMRMTVVPVDIMTGLTSNPVHTVCSSLSSSSSKNILSASSAGVCMWNLDGYNKGPQWIPEAGRQDVCVSVASNPGGEQMVASFRPRVEELKETQPWCTQTSLWSTSMRVRGSHILLERRGRLRPGLERTGSTSAMVDEVRLPKTVIVEPKDGYRLFASTDNDTCGTVLHHLPSFAAVQSLRTPGGPLRDIKYTAGGMLGCLSDHTLQLFSVLHT